MSAIAVLAIGCGGADELAESESPAGARGCEGIAFGHCLVCNDLNECDLQQCGYAPWYFWTGAHNDDRARCRDLVSRWAGPRVCSQANVEAYTYWFKPTSGDARVVSRPAPCD